MAAHSSASTAQDRTSPHAALGRRPRAIRARQIGLYYARRTASRSQLVSRSVAAHVAAGLQDRGEDHPRGTTNTKGGPEDAVAVPRVRFRQRRPSHPDDLEGGFLRRPTHRAYKPSSSDGDFLYGSSGRDHVDVPAAEWDGTFALTKHHRGEPAAGWLNQAQERASRTTSGTRSRAWPPRTSATRLRCSAYILTSCDEGNSARRHTSRPVRVYNNASLVAASSVHNVRCDANRP